MTSSQRWEHYILNLALPVLLLGGLSTMVHAKGTVPKGSDHGGTLTVCHRLTTDSGPRTERRINEADWADHAKHGDTRGACVGFSRVASYEGSNLQDFYINADTELKYLHTADALKVYRNDTIHRTLESDSTHTVRLSKTGTTRAVRCDDLSIDFEADDEKSLQCQLIGPEGGRSDTAYFPNHSHAKALLGNRLLVSERGEPHLYDYTEDTSVWRLGGKVRELYTGDSYRYFLSVHTEEFESFHQLRRLRNARLISSRKIRAFQREISPDGSYLYLVESDPGSKTKVLTVFNRGFERVARWEGLPFYGSYDGAFAPEHRKVYVPLRNGKLLIGDLESGDRIMKPFPGEAFVATVANLDQRRGLLYLYGVMASDETTSFLSSERERRLIVFDTETGEFLSRDVVFSADNYDFSSNVATVRLRLLGNNILALQHPNRLEVYRFRRN